MVKTEVAADIFLYRETQNFKGVLKCLETICSSFYLIKMCKALRNDNIFIIICIGVCQSVGNFDTGGKHQGPLCVKIGKQNFIITQRV
jgi:hypothetical protein